MLETFAKENRRNMTDAEMRLWYFLKDKKISGLKFRRQHVIEPYIVDFYCRDAGIVIEIDGEQHAFNKEYDDARTHYLQNKGFKVLRFWNNDVIDNVEGVIEAILSNLE